MANLTDTTIKSVIVTGSFDGGNITSSPCGVSGFKNNGGGNVTTFGNLEFNGIRTNVGGIGISNNNSRFTVPYDGFYTIWYRDIGSSSNDTCITYVRKNGSNINSRAYGRGEEFNYPMTLCFTVEQLIAGDYIEFYHGTGTQFQSSVGDYVQFAIYRIG